MFEKLKDVFTSKHAKTIYWGTAVSYIPLLITALEVFKVESVNATTILLIGAGISGLNAFTKWANKTYL